MNESYVIPEGWSFFSYQQIDSTNETVKKIMKTTDNRKIVVQSDVQTKGKGRRGREWISPEGNLYVSLGLRISEISRLGEFSFLTAVALADALSGLSPQIKAECKWPNDILVKGRKISGILLETDGNKGIEFLVIGLGVNLVPLSQEKLLYPITSLQEEGLSISKERMLSAFLERFEGWMKRRKDEGFSAVVSAWCKRAYGIGRHITVNLPDRQLHGIFSGIDKEGTLLLNMGGKEYRITAGDVFFGTK